MPSIKFTHDEVELIQVAISYLLDNIPDAEDMHDISISEDELLELELKLSEEGQI